ncbi:MAG: hypothetical protein EOO60_01040 [Hymenobacter sp.]|nr:MAG: hypothetical protein EOO60_01040 [Hymenobacter sp.]
MLPTGSDIKSNADHLAAAHPDLIFMQDLGMVPKRIVSPGRVGPAPKAERKWLGTDFSHTIVSHSS